MRKLIETLESRRLLSATWYVDANATGATHDGTTWDTAFLEIQQGLTSAVAGDEIHVADGSYLSTTASRVVLKNNLSVLGSFAGSGAVAPDSRDLLGTPSVIYGSSSSGSPDALVLATGVYAPTVFDGFTLQSNSFSGTSIRTDSSTLTIGHCVFHGGRGITNIKSAPTISDCLFDSLSNGYGGGGLNNTGVLVAGTPIAVTNCQFVSCFGGNGGAMLNSDAAVVMTGCTFAKSSAAHEGQIIYGVAGTTAAFIDCNFVNNGHNFDPDRLVYNAGSELAFTRCNFIDNYGNGIGGIINSTSARPLTLTDCVFRNNGSDYAGGAVYSIGGGPVTISGSIFQGNSTYGYGGAVYAVSQDVRITNSVFSNNYVSEHGGGALYLSSGTAMITNCTFSGNWVDPPTGVGGAIMLYNVAMTLRNSVLWGDVAGDGQEIYIVPGGSSSVVFDHSVVKGPSDFSSPFVRLPSPGADGYYGTADDDYGDLRLRLSSNTVDAGDNSFVPAGITTDIAGNPRFVDVPGRNDPGAIVDIGAYEYVAPLAVTSGSYLVDAVQPTIAVTFNGDVKDWATLTAGDLVLLDPVTNLPIAGLPSSAVTYHSGTRTATWVFSAALPDGNYRAKMAAGSVTDTAGNPLSADFVFDFFVLPGDANRDRIVDVNDLLILATNWYGTAKTFTQGDFNHDGVVNQTDLGILAIHWQQKLAPPPLPSAPVPTRAASIAVRKPTRMASDVIL